MNLVSYGVGGWLGMLMAYLWARKYDRTFIEAVPVVAICATLGSSLFFLFAELSVVFGNMILFTIETMFRPEVLVFAGIPILSLELVIHFGDAAILGLIGMKPLEVTQADEIEQDAATAPTPSVSSNSSTTESSDGEESGTESGESEESGAESGESEESGAESGESEESGAESSEGEASGTESSEGEASGTESSETNTESTHGAQADNESAHSTSNGGTSDSEQSKTSSNDCVDDFIPVSTLPSVTTEVSAPVQ
jgi:hypothetical protein